MTTQFSGPLFTSICVALVLAMILSSAVTRATSAPRREQCRKLAASGGFAVQPSSQVLARWRRRRIERAMISPGAVAEWCDALARSLRAGTSLRSALTAIEPADPALAHRSEPLRQAIGRGTTVSAAVDMLRSESASPPRRHSPHLALAGAVLATSGSIGGPTAASLDRLARALRLRVADGQERSAHSAQARLSGHVLTVVPLGLLALLLATDADVRAVLGQPTGLALVSFGLGLNLAGWWWMRRIVEAGT